MKAPETFESGEQTETPVRGACLISGCSCKDSRLRPWVLSELRQRKA
jgi:hypothetical protein